MQKKREGSNACSSGSPIAIEMVIANLICAKRQTSVGCIVESIVEDIVEITQLNSPTTNTDYMGETYKRGYSH